MVQIADIISNMDDTSLTIAFPYEKNVDGQVGRIGYYGFRSGPDPIKIGLTDGLDKLDEIIDAVDPDIIHVWGTEAFHSYGVAAICNERKISDKLVISIQGMLSVYSKHIFAYLPYDEIKKKTLRDILKGGYLARRHEFEIGGKFEIEAIRLTHNVIGRTDWDRACSYYINPKARYYYNSELLRKSFYDGDRWDHKTCERYSIFMSQVHYPIKGFHIAIEALCYIKNKYPGVRLKCAGVTYYDKPRYKQSSYERYISNLIHSNGLEGNIIFLGPLKEQEMKQELLKANVYICASSIENSPNSLSEAMMLGVPCVSSFVGGIGNLVEHGKTGFLYPADEPYMLAYYIEKYFEDKTLCCKISEPSVTVAKKRHDKETIVKELVDIYKDILL